MAAAIFGLIGVVVGGVLTGVVTWLIQRSQTISATRAAARLTYDDFLHCQSTLVRALATATWWDRDTLLPPQVEPADRRLLLGQLGDAPSQEVAAAQGWMNYLEGRRKGLPDHVALSDQDARALRDTFCRLDRGRWQLSGSVSGRKFGSFEDGGVLATLDYPTTLEALGISDQTCRERRKAGYGREG